MRRVLAPGALALVGAFLFAPGPASAQLPGQGVEFTLPRSILNLRLPNGSGKSLLTPTGWGAAYNTGFGGLGYQFAGFSQFSLGAKVHRYLGLGTSVAAGGRLIELAGLTGGTIRMLRGITRREVNRLLGSPLYTSLLQKAGIIDFDSEGRLIRGPALETGNGGESGRENESGKGKTRR